MVDVNVRGLPTRAISAANATNKSKRGGRRVNRNQSFEDLFTGNSFGGEHATSNHRRTSVGDSTDEGSLNSVQVNFAAPFSHVKGAHSSRRNHFVGESDDEEMSMDGTEELFSNEKRGGRRRGKKPSSSNGEESESYDAGSVDFNDGDFDYNIQSDEEGENADLEASFSWTKPVSAVPSALKNDKDNMQALQNAFNASFSSSKKSPTRKEKKHIPLSTIITTASAAGTPACSVASGSVTGQKTKDNYDKSSTGSPTAVNDDEAFNVQGTADVQNNSGHESFFAARAKASEAPEAPIDTNTPQGVAGTYVMAPATRARSRCRAASRTRGASRTRSRSRSCTRERNQDNAEFPSMFPSDDDEAKVEMDFFADNNQPDKTSAATTTPTTASSSSEPERSGRSSSRSRDSGKSSRSRSKSRSRTSSSSKEGERPSGKVTRIRIKTKGNRKLDPATAKKLITERMKQLKDSGDHSESSLLLESMNELFHMEKSGASTNSLKFNASAAADLEGALKEDKKKELKLNASTGDLADALKEEKKKDKKQKKKSKDGDDKEKKKKSKKKIKESHDLEGSFTESSLSKNDSFNASARFDESFNMSSNIADNFQTSKPRLSLVVEESPLEGGGEREGRSQSKGKSSSRGRSESPMKRSKSGESKENEKKERSGRSKSPTKRKKKEDDKANRESNEDKSHSKSHSSSGERSGSKAPTERSKERRSRSKSRIRTEGRARSKSRTRTEEKEGSKSKIRT